MASEEPPCSYLPIDNADQHNPYSKMQNNEDENNHPDDKNDVILLNNSTTNNRSRIIPMIREHDTYVGCFGFSCCSVFMLCAVIFFSVLGTSMFNFGCYKGMGACEDFVMLPVKITNYDIKKCNTNQNYDCFESYAIGSFTYLNETKKCLLSADAHSQSAFKAKTDAEIIYPINSTNIYYININTFTCSLYGTLSGIVVSGIISWVFSALFSIMFCYSIYLDLHYPESRRTRDESMCLFFSCFCILCTMCNVR